ncbi:MAG: branched-chain amino acid ABC transporter permease [Pseudomonadota bacterium]
MTQVLVNGFVVGTTYALVALGLTIAFSILRFVNFAHGQLYVMGGFVVYYLYGVADLPFILAIVTAALVVGALGWIIERFLFGPAMLRLQREEASMLLAMGLALFLEELAYLLFGEKQRGAPALASGIYRIGEAYLPAGRAAVVVISLVLIATVVLFIRFTRQGRALQAIAQDREAAALQGIDLKAHAALGFALGAALAAIAGGLLITIFGMHAGGGTAISIKAFLMIMLGGAGVVSGAILGGFLIGFAESIGYMLLPGTVTYLVIFAGMIVFLIIRPQGLIGRPWG